MSTDKTSHVVGASSSKPYRAKHSEHTGNGGFGLIPLGDRNRVRPNEIYLVGNAQEAEEVSGPYAKFLKPAGDRDRTTNKVVPSERTFGSGSTPGNIRHFSD